MSLRQRNRLWLVGMSGGAGLLYGCVLLMAVLMDKLWLHCLAVLVQGFSLDGAHPLSIGACLICAILPALVVRHFVLPYPKYWFPVAWMGFLVCLLAGPLMLCQTHLFLGDAADLAAAFFCLTLVLGAHLAIARHVPLLRLAALYVLLLATWTIALLSPFAPLLTAAD